MDRVLLSGPVPAGSVGVLPEQRPAVGPPPRTVLLAMPWESVQRPSLALGLLSALAREAGVECDVLHLNLTWAAQLGSPVYGAFAENLDLFPLGEHVFAVDLFGCDALDSDAYLTRFGGSATAPGANPDPLHLMRDVEVPAFLDAAVEQVVALRPEVVGFSCTFNQVLPSLALAARVKRALPSVRVLLGGACVHGPMGEAYAEAFGGFIDHVFTGESDDSFPAWLHAWREGDPDRRLAGVVGRAGGRPPRLTHDLDRLPLPDYTAFFQQHQQLRGDRLTDELRHLPYESSRGCWWGERHHCTFCGLNNEGMLYRRKSAARVVHELESLSAAYGTTSLMAADNILDFHAYRDLLRLLTASPVDFDLFYEIKANVHRRDVAALAGAGVRRVQPGVESFSDAVLTLMRKGIAATGNVQLIKWLQEHGIEVDYNLLVGFPGETAGDYAQIIAVMRAIPHLPPPHGSPIPVRVDRFSPFYTDPDGLGIRNMRPAEQYRFLIPPSVLEPERYAYFFDRDLEALTALAEPLAEIQELLELWQEGTVWRRARLGPDFVEVLTVRDGRRERQVLRGTAAKVFVLADSQTTTERLQRRLGLPVGDALDELEHAGVLLRAGGRLVTTIAYDTVHSEEQLQAWLVSAGVLDVVDVPEPQAVTT